ncbi:D-alanyl-D-alanine carboxypeptidase / D-alanyl-D-alanine-endopeptidase (penicillin-binding protein 4) [Desulfocicer vacuolatum DSM 3385]|uniref:D-alanyl-D-alanine carboxypeptidase / D-alanyl-D-alanine-endopeptidase (Penicillin-binding protein 4) n=2 Tax=Desulfocicer vacuolatum TaxID=2298 RepID=A0A1W1ZD13_9BACT|nr:D-alanyl-D-alanine carboxypeptidase / D-alanyl-D-alanine-endopeptidase (penicillin-binding protein 4) [Desulfocicer vacuolatum DSM 3385]
MARELTPGAGIILAAPEGEILFEKNATRQFIPASTIKVFTALTALKYLGENFHFTTDFLLDKHLNLKIRGQGDPLLTSREIRTVSTHIKKILQKNHISHIQQIMVDGSAFKKGIVIPGTGGSKNPYDAPVGALSANFNTISFKTTGPKSGGDAPPAAGSATPWISAEKETPLVPFAREIIAGAGMKSGRIPLAHGTQALYAGHLFTWFLEKEGIKTEKTITMAEVNAGDRLMFAWRSPYDLRQVVAKLLYYSNNFMANQLFLTLALKQEGAPATLEKGIKVAMAHAASLGIKDLFIEEGSGLSRQNRISPRSMLRILQAFKPHHGLMRYEKNEYYKTGTLQGVRTRCGYFQNRQGELYPFVIMVNQENKGYEKIKKKLQKIVREWKIKG